MCVSRSFGEKVTSFEDLYKALSDYISKGAEKLRKQKQKTASFSIFIETNRFAQEGRYKNFKVVDMHTATNDTRAFLSASKSALKDIYRKGLLYQKAGVIFYDLIPEETQSLDLFEPQENPESRALMKTMDHLNQRFGENTLRFINTKNESHPWMMKSNHRSKRYTTSFKELKKVF